MSGQNPNFPVSPVGLQQLSDAKRTIDALLGVGKDAMLQSKRGQLIPFQTYYLDMLFNNTINTPFKIGPHKSILYRGIIALSGTTETPQAFTSNDFAYYWAGPNKPSDPRLWSKMQVGKTFEFEVPFSEGWIWIPNTERNPTFAIFETSVLAKIRSYTVQEGSLGNVRLTSGTLLEPSAAVAVTDASVVEIVAVGTEGRTVTLYNAGPNKAWLGGTDGSTNEAIQDGGVPILSGEKVQLYTASGISAICSAGETASISSTIEE